MIEKEFTFEIFKEGSQYNVYIGEEDGSGAQYKVSNYKEVGERVTQYLEIYYSGD